MYRSRSRDRFITMAARWNKHAASSFLSGVNKNENKKARQAVCQDKQRKAKGDFHRQSRALRSYTPFTMPWGINDELLLLFISAFINRKSLRRRSIVASATSSSLVGVVIMEHNDVSVHRWYNIFFFPSSN